MSTGCAKRAELLESLYTDLKEPPGPAFRLSSMRFFLVSFLITALAAAEVFAANTTLAERTEQLGPVVRPRLRPWFERQRVTYPPSRLVMYVVKDEKRLKIFAPSDEDEDSWRFVVQYEVARLSGKAGPKLKSGDKQVPEGIYDITYLHPTSKYWLSLGLDYPNEFDRAKARRDGRSNLGGDIMIHGWWFSTGCVAVGNTAAEDLFMLARDVDPDKIKVIISPTDLRTTSPAKAASLVKTRWAEELYDNILDEISVLGDDGNTTDARLISYADIAPPPVKAKSFLENLIDALIEAVETSNSKTLKKPDTKGKGH